MLFKSPRRITKLISRSKSTYSDWPFLKDEHKMVLEMCKNFADTELIPIAGELDKNHTFPKAQIKKLGGLIPHLELFLI